MPTRSREDGVETQEGARTRLGANIGPDQYTRATNKRHRVGEYQPRDAEGDGEGQRSDEANTRQTHGGEGRRDDVRIAFNLPPILCLDLTTMALAADTFATTGRNCGNRMRSATRLSRP
jgi:hypothetical protein